MASLISNCSPSLLLCAPSDASSLLSLRRPCARVRTGRCRTATLCIRAAKLPSGVEAPKEEPKLPSALWGFTENAERWNSRAAMIGIFGLFLVELIIQKGVLQVIGLEVGKGLNLPL